jgi:hypothetical protein
MNQKISHISVLPQTLLEKGEDPATLVIAFTGFAGRLSISPFDFFSLTGLLKYNRILLRDESKTCYMAGIPPIARDFEALVEFLEDHVKQLAPKRVILIGTSGGSHGAILFGHLLKADYVHAFSAYTTVDPEQWKMEDSQELPQRQDVLDRMSRLPERVHRYFDLRNVLKEWNGKTRYNLHVCEKSEADFRRANRLLDLPGVTIHRYPCSHHRVAIWLGKRGLLLPLFKFENQDAPAQVVSEQRDLQT